MVVEYCSTRRGSHVEKNVVRRRRRSVCSSKYRKILLFEKVRVVGISTVFRQKLYLLLKLSRSSSSALWLGNINAARAEIVIITEPCYGGKALNDQKTGAILQSIIDRVPSFASTHYGSNHGSN